jgi:hypothetical protein
MRYQIWLLTAWQILLCATGVPISAGNSYLAAGKLPNPRNNSNCGPAYAGSSCCWCLPLPRSWPWSDASSPRPSINCSHGGTGGVEPTYRALSNLSNFVEFWVEPLLYEYYESTECQLSQPPAHFPQSRPLALCSSAR